MPGALAKMGQTRVRARPQRELSPWQDTRSAT